MGTLHIPEFEKKTLGNQAALIFEDEASFRQDPTLHQTWARRGCQPLIPTTGRRETQKIFHAIDLYAGQFYYHQDAVFNSDTYIRFLTTLADRYRYQRVYLIHDNASYHKSPEIRDWLSDYWRNFRLVLLPAYSPELNAAERIWHHVRMTSTHNRYFSTEQELHDTLHSTFRSIQRRPEQIQGYMYPFL